MIPMPVLMLLAIVALVVAAFYWLRITRTTLYWHTASGFRAFQSHPPPSHRAANQGQCRKAIDLLLQGEHFDTLILLHSADPLSEGVTFSYVEEAWQLSCGFLSLKQQELKSRAIANLAALGLQQEEDHVWNEGMGEDMEMVTVTFIVPTDAARMHEAAEAALAVWPGDAETRYLCAMKMADFPTDRMGPVFVRFHDPLEGLL
ncbi:MAG: hypothetical protein ABL962_11815 [Fimbriimonadaceae bacterium]